MRELSKNDQELFEKANPVFNTAKTTLFQLARQGNPYAIAISEKMGLTEDTQKSRSFSMGTDEETTFRIILETRYSMMGSLAISSGFPVFVDLPCGYTPRAIEMSEQGIAYFGLDLPPVISEIGSIIPPLVSEKNRNLVRFCPADATNFKSLEKALQDAKGNICINTEGLLMYFTDKEMITFLENIAKLLEIHGGCWITADPEIASEHIRIQSAIHPGGTDFDTVHMLSEKSDTGDLKNILQLRYGHEKEDFKKAEAILSEHGLKAERIRIAGHLEKTEVFSTLTSDQKEAVLKAVEDIAFWKVVSVGPARNINMTETHSFTIHSELTDDVLNLRLAGRLDSLTAPQLLEAYETQSASGSIRKVQADCTALDYISSAGLRVLLIMRKGSKEGVSLTGVNDVCADILMQTGLSEILDIKTDSPGD
jgi:anti-anti-sigma factor